MIRSAIPSDAKAIAQVHIRSWQQAYRDLMPSEYLGYLAKTLPQRVSYWTNTIQSGDSTLLVAELDKQVIGWISVGASRDPDAAMDNAGEVMALYVLEEHWQTGIGRALWNAGLQSLNEQRHSRLTLWVLVRNDRAIRFYRKAGWAEETETRRNLVRGGVTLEEVRYESPIIR